MSYYELFFLKVEVLVWLNRKDEVVEVLKDVVVVVIVNVEIGVLVVFSVFIVEIYGGVKEIIKVIIVIEVEEYFINNVKLLFDVNLVKEVMV